MFLDVDFRSRERSFFVPFLTATESLNFLFEVHRQVVFYKDAEPNVTQKILTSEPHKISEKTYLAYTREDYYFRQLGRHVWCLPALAINGKYLSWLSQIFMYYYIPSFEM